MRLLLGLDHASSGVARVNGRRYAELAWPLREVAAVLEARSFHPGRSAFDHLLALATSNRIRRSRVLEVLELVGLAKVAGRRAGTLSLGMGQRLSLAAALLGDPGILLLDEPTNGLDPEGIRWIRQLLRSLAAEGRAVFVSSHMIGEMALTETGPAPSTTATPAATATSAGTRRPSLRRPAASPSGSRRCREPG